MEDFGLRENGFRAGFDYATLWRGCWVHLPENGSLGYCGLGDAICKISTRFSKEVV